MVTRREMLDAQDEFSSLLDKRNASEQDFQKLFTKYPFILSNALPVHLEAADIRPLGRPGKSEVDFVFYPQTQRTPFVYGAIELKRPDTSILRIPRHDTVVLSADAATASRQAELAAAQLKTELEDRHERFLGVGNAQYTFLIMGLSSELRRVLKDDQLRRKWETLLPPNCRLMTYDSLLREFERRMGRGVFLVNNRRVDKNGISWKFWDAADSLLSKGFDRAMGFWCRVNAKKSKRDQVLMRLVAMLSDLRDRGAIAELVGHRLETDILLGIALTPLPGEQLMAQLAYAAGGSQFVCADGSAKADWTGGYLQAGYWVTKQATDQARTILSYACGRSIFCQLDRGRGQLGRFYFLPRKARL